MADTKTAVTKGQKVKPRENVTVYGTGKAKHLKTGKAYTMHRVAADKLLNSGKVSLEPTEPTEEKAVESTGKGKK